ncbi:MAG: hypothetical protein J5965_26380, partial [Aeriscardovia sp.]|nr:hypothetical protein [Aeriscardovia sp.]
MVDFFSNMAHRIGMDKAIAYSSGSRVVQGVMGIGSVFFISTYLSGVEQGFYYTFGSIIALQIFFELGLTGIITQYVAHEVANLSLNENGEFDGDKMHKSRLASLVHFCARWYSVLAIVVFLFLLTVGIFFFKSYSKNYSDVQWLIPWILVCLATSCNMFISPFSSILMGVGKVKEMSKIGFVNQLLLPSVNWIGLFFGFRLYVLGITSLLGVLLWAYYLQKMRLVRIVINLWKVNITDSVAYKKEIFPYQWRIALSWVSGYFIFQLFNPVLFATEGAVVAGQMGMTMTALNAIQAFSMSWLNTKVPLYSQLIALKDYLKLDTIFNTTLKQMVRVCVLLLACFFLLIVFLNVTQLHFGENVIAERFLGYIPVLLLMFTIYLNQYTSSWATYLRCHKQEPFLVISICGALADGFSTLVFGHLFGLYGIV